MSDDIALAQRVVALGIRYGLPPHRLVRDPRVAMALMERCVKPETFVDCTVNRNSDFVGCVMHRVDSEGEQDGEGFYQSIGESKGDSLPRAIVEACCLALEES